MADTQEQIRNMEARLDMLEPKPRHVAAISYAIGVLDGIDLSLAGPAEEALREYRDQIDPDNKLEDAARDQGALFEEGDSA